MDPFANSMGLLGPTQFPSQPTGGFPRSGFHHPDLPPPGFVDPATQVFNAAPENVNDYWNRIAMWHGHDDAGMGDPNLMGVTDVATGPQAGMDMGQPASAPAAPQGMTSASTGNRMGTGNPFDYEWTADDFPKSGMYQPLDTDLRPTNSALQSGDMVNFTAGDGVAPPPAIDGGRWHFVGTQDGSPIMIGAAGGDNGYNPGAGNTPDMQTWQWVAEQPAPAPQQAPPPQRDPETTPQQWDPNRLYEDDDYFLNMSRRSVEGLNRMPFVGPQSMRYGFNTGQSGYADIPYDPLLAMDSFYPNFLQGWQDNMLDPFDGEQLQHQLSGT